MRQELCWHGVRHLLSWAVVFGYQCGFLLSLVHVLAESSCEIRLSVNSGHVFRTHALLLVPCSVCLGVVPVAGEVSAFSVPRSPNLTTPRKPERPMGPATPLYRVAFVEIQLLVFPFSFVPWFYVNFVFASTSAFGLAEFLLGTFGPESLFSFRCLRSGWTGLGLRKAGPKWSHLLPT